MTVPSETTRSALIEAAIPIFAEHGYAGGSVRLITRAAGANQAAITYHFGGKDELYRVVLRTAVAAFEAHSLIDEEGAGTLDRVEALRTIIRQFLLPLKQNAHLAPYIQIFGRESFDPSPIFTTFILEERPCIYKAVDILMRRFLAPDVTEREVLLTSFWLVQQPVAFIRNANRLRQPPYAMSFDDAECERLIDFLAELCLGGLLGEARRGWPGESRKRSRA